MYANNTKNGQKNPNYLNKSKDHPKESQGGQNVKGYKKDDQNVRKERTKETNQLLIKI